MFARFHDKRQQWGLMQDRRRARIECRISQQQARVLIGIDHGDIIHEVRKRSRRGKPVQIDRANAVLAAGDHLRRHGKRRPIRVHIANRKQFPCALVGKPFLDDGLWAGEKQRADAVNIGDPVIAAPVSAKHTPTIDTLLRPYALLDFADQRIGVDLLLWRPRFIVGGTEADDEQLKHGEADQNAERFPSHPCRANRRDHGDRKRHRGEQRILRRGLRLDDKRAHGDNCDNPCPRKYPAA
ncbi:MAG: hypothetical protein B6D42_13795 [Anaerolineae bacterium UTCFX5]|nr:MAG: hypothetical protein B6D42_13795 [Anaerolineae bacterium UTCFX5]